MGEGEKKDEGVRERQVNGQRVRESEGMREVNMAENIRSQSKERDQERTIK